MTLLRLSSFPVVSDELRARVSPALKVSLSCPNGPPPGELAIAPFRYVLGRTSDWSVREHDLQIDCALADPSVLSTVFGPTGLVCRAASVMVVLEWTSAKTARRGFSAPRLISKKDTSGTDPLSFTLSFAEREVLGDLQVTLQLFVGVSGRPAEGERHLANDVGVRLGAISETWELVFDGQGSLFPITQAKHEPTEPLWKLVVEDWEDAAFDEFTSEFVSLEINESHPAFAELYGAASAPYATNLFRQVMASWLLVFFDVLEERTTDVEADPESGDGTTLWQAIIDENGSHRDHLLPGSIAKAASEFVARGELDFSSNGAFLHSAQVWIDQRFGNG
jgi:hypothetical protein